MGKTYCLLPHWLSFWVILETVLLEDFSELVSVSGSLESNIFRIIQKHHSEAVFLLSVVMASNNCDMLLW